MLHIDKSYNQILDIYHWHLQNVLMKYYLHLK